MPRTLDRFLRPDEQARIVEAIVAAEARTSGEIKVHIEPRCRRGSPYQRAVALFSRLGLAATKDRNAVLLYLASDDRKYAFIGDVGIHRHVGDDFWRAAGAALADKLRAGAPGEGIIAAISAVGDRLAAEFPATAAKVNQLSDEISSGDP